jgi:transposase
MKYVGIDAHSASCVFVAISETGKVVVRRTVPTEIEAIRRTMFELGPNCSVVFEEGEMSAWLYEVLRGLARDVTVYNPRKSPRGSKTQKTDRRDAEKLARWLAQGVLSTPVYKEMHGTERLSHLVRAYNTVVADRTRAKNRLKSLLRSQAIAARGGKVFAASRREGQLSELERTGARERAELLMGEIDALTALVTRAQRAMTTELGRHPAAKYLLTIPGYGPVRTAQVIAAIRTPSRFRRNRMLWAYGGLAVVTHSSGETVYQDGVAQRRAHATHTRGLNLNYNRAVKEAFKGAALYASRHQLAPIYQALCARGLAPELARVTIARKIATLTLTLWKKGEAFDVTKLIR